MIPLGITSQTYNDFKLFVRKELENSDSILSIAKSNILDLQSRLKPSKNKYIVLEKICNDFENFILYTPKQQEEFIKECVAIQSNIFFYKPLSTKRKSTRFGTKILKLLNYEEFRNKYASEIAKSIGLKACPYCNAMLTIVAEDNNGQKKNFFQLDHFFSKAKHPLLSISLFNLIPSCGNCNNSKSSGDVKLGEDFQLYADETPKNAFEFIIPDANKAKYINTNDSKDIKILFRGKSGFEEYCKNHDEAYDISGLYETQIDIVEEMFWKSKIYNETRILEIAKLLSKSPNEVKRMVVGNYHKPEEIHKRPLAKFQQDMAKEAGLIK